MMVWSWSQRRVLKTFLDDENGISPDQLVSRVADHGEVVVERKTDERVIVVDGVAGKVLRTLPRSLDEFVLMSDCTQICADISSDGRRIIVVGTANRAKTEPERTGESAFKYAALILDPAGQLISRTPPIYYLPDAVSMSADGTRFAVAAERRITVFSTEDGKQIYEIPGRLPMLFSPEGRFLVAGSEDEKSLVVTNTANGHPLTRLSVNWRREGVIAYSCDGSLFASAGITDNSLYDLTVWETSDWRKRWTHTDGDERIDALHVSDDGHYLAYKHGSDIATWNLQTGQMLSYEKRIASPNTVVRLDRREDKMILDRVDREESPPNGCNPANMTNVFPIEVRESASADSSDGSATAFLELRGRNGFRVRRKNDTADLWADDWWLWSSEDPKTVNFNPFPTVEALAIYDAGACVIGVDDAGRASMRDLNTGKPIQHLVLQPFEGLLGNQGKAAIDRNTGRVAYSLQGRTALADLVHGKALWTWDDHFNLPTQIGPAFSSDGKLIAVPRFRGFAILNSQDGSVVATYLTESTVTSVAFLPSGDAILIGTWDGDIFFWNFAHNQEQLLIQANNADDWIVAAPDGSFDAGHMDVEPPFRWRFNDDTLNLFGPESYTRDYFEPGLLSRQITGSHTAPSQSVYSLDRALPKVVFDQVRVTDDGIAHVEVTVISTSVATRRQGMPVTDTSGVYDLHLTAGGSLRAELPPPPSTTPTTVASRDVWRKNECVIGQDERLTQETLQFDFAVPTRSLTHDIVFTAYAFNADRVKGHTSVLRVAVRPQAPKRQKRLFLITIGVSGNQNPNWRLSYASKDSIAIRDALTQLLRHRQLYDRIIEYQLTRNLSALNQQAESASAMVPTKAAIRAALTNGLAGVTPDDDVVIIFSGHGVIDESGHFALLPYDLPRDDGAEITPGLLTAAIRSTDLEDWMRPVDPRRVFLILNCCHAAASVQENGFRPAPLGDSGFGQLSYDKGMYVLAATAFYGSIQLTGADGFSATSLAIHDVVKSLRSTPTSCSLSLEYVLRAVNTNVSRKQLLLVITYLTDTGIAEQCRILPDENRLSPSVAASSRSFAGDP
jgi:WD40 repeat protein